jgi:hypothetical protein
VAAQDADKFTQLAALESRSHELDGKKLQATELRLIKVNMLQAA